MGTGMRAYDIFPMITLEITGNWCWCFMKSRSIRLERPTYVGLDLFGVIHICILFKKGLHFSHKG